MNVCLTHDQNNCNNGRPASNAEIAFTIELCNLIAGGILRVSKRLDARYDWLPSPSTALAKYGHLLVVFVGDACDANMFMNVKDDYLALVSMEGVKCSYFTKVSSFSFTFQHIVMGLPWPCLSTKLFNLLSDVLSLTRYHAIPVGPKLRKKWRPWSFGVCSSVPSSGRHEL